MDPLDEDHGVELRVVAHAPDRILAVHRPCRHRRGVIAENVGDRLVVPAGPAAKVCAAVPERDEPDVPRRVVEEEVNPARKSNVRRGDEHGIVAGHTDDEHREPRPCDVLPVVVHRAPETGGPLPEAEVGDLHLLVHERVPPGTGRGSIRGIREGLAELIPLELGPDKGRGEPAHRRSRSGAKSSGHASLEPAPPRRVLRILYPSEDRAEEDEALRTAGDPPRFCVGGGSLESVVYATAMCSLGRTPTA